MLCLPRMSMTKNDNHDKINSHIFYSTLNKDQGFGTELKICTYYLKNENKIFCVFVVVVVVFVFFIYIKNLALMKG